MVTARRLISVRSETDHALVIYAAGLAVETLLQAHALRMNARHDARHDLLIWLSKTSSPMSDALRHSTSWSFVAAYWNNSLRYLSSEALLGYLRNKSALRRYTGTPQEKVHAFTKDFVRSAEQVHGIGVSIWLG